MLVHRTPGRQSGDLLNLFNTPQRADQHKLSKKRKERTIYKIYTTLKFKFTISTIKEISDMI